MNKEKLKKPITRKGNFGFNERSKEYLEYKKSKIKIKNYEEKYTSNSIKELEENIEKFEELYKRILNEVYIQKTTNLTQLSDEYGKKYIQFVRTESIGMKRLLNQIANMYLKNKNDN